jgi:hypothetical protein
VVGQVPAILASGEDQHVGQAPGVLLEPSPLVKQPVALIPCQVRVSELFIACADLLFQGLERAFGREAHRRIERLPFPKTLQIEIGDDSRIESKCPPGDIGMGHNLPFGIARLEQAPLGLLVTGGGNQPPGLRRRGARRRGHRPAAGALRPAGELLFVNPLRPDPDFPQVGPDGLSMFGDHLGRPLAELHRALGNLYRAQEGVVGELFDRQPWPRGERRPGVLPALLDTRLGRLFGAVESIESNIAL